MFALVCRFDRKRPVVVESVRTIRRLYPDAEIVVTDSASEDKSYFAEMHRLGAKVEDIGNRHYEAGALWHVNAKYPRDHYFFMQDTVILRDRVDDLAQHDVSGMMWWNGWDGCAPKHLDWGREALARSEYAWLDDGFKMVFGCMLFCRREVLDRLAKKRFDRVLPDDKTGSESMERLFGIALQHEGYGDRIPETFDSPWVGCEEQDGVKYTATKRMVKVWLGRQ